jgi:hypothetical protein
MTREEAVQKIAHAMIYAFQHDPSITEVCGQLAMSGFIPSLDIGIDMLLTEASSDAEFLRGLHIAPDLDLHPAAPYLEPTPPAPERTFMEPKRAWWARWNGRHA